MHVNQFHANKSDPPLEIFVVKKKSVTNVEAFSNPKHKDHLNLNIFKINLKTQKHTFF